MLIWIVFLSFILVLLTIDLGVFHRRAHIVSVREALMWTTVWIATALAFAAFVYVGYDRHWLGMGLAPDPVERSDASPEGRINDPKSAVLKFLIGYVVELSLSVDNVFVIAMLFTYTAIPPMYQHRVLFWGILGAMVMRGAMIALGAQLVSQFSWILSVFGVLLILTAGKMAFMSTEARDLAENALVRLMRRFLPLTKEFHGEHFFVRATTADAAGSPTPRHGRRVGWALTPLAPALIMVETTDLVFAVDSIPAIFAITADPFLVFTSNVFAILGLRSLYFALAGALHMFRYLKHALAIVLLTVGVKMLAHSWLKQILGPNFNLYLLATILGILGLGVLASLVDVRWRKRLSTVVGRISSWLQAWIVPDRLISRILTEARRSASADAARSDVQPSTPRISPITKLWRRLFRGNARHTPVVFIPGILEEALPFAIYL